MTINDLTSDERSTMPERHTPLRLSALIAAIGISGMAADCAHYEGEHRIVKVDKLPIFQFWGIEDSPTCRDYSPEEKVILEHTIPPAEWDPPGRYTICRMECDQTELPVILMNCQSQYGSEGEVKWDPKKND